MKAVARVSRRGHPWLFMFGVAAAGGSILAGDWATLLLSVGVIVWTVRAVVR